MRNEDFPVATRRRRDGHEDHARDAAASAGRSRRGRRRRKSRPEEAAGTPCGRSCPRTRAMRSGSCWSSSRSSRCSGCGSTRPGPVGDFLTWLFRGSLGVVARSRSPSSASTGASCCCATRPARSACGCSSASRVLGARRARDRLAARRRPGADATATTRVAGAGGVLGAFVAHPLAIVISPIGAAIVCLGIARARAADLHGDADRGRVADVRRLLHRGRRRGGGRARGARQLVADEPAGRSASRRASGT